MHCIYVNGKLKRLEESPFKLERDMQGIVEPNLGLLFDLKFIRSEFALGGFRVDTLAFDEQAKAFVIIEYKRDKNFSVVDQGFAYLSLMLNNKADFILEYNENISAPLKKDEIDWSQSRVIFISSTFTDYQRQAINFKDLPIELWEIKRYEDNAISLNQIVSFASNESIKTISKNNTEIGKVSKEVKKYIEDDHLDGIPEETVQLYKKFRGMVLNISDEIKIRPRKVYIGFVAKTNFTDVEVQSLKLKIFLNLKVGKLDDPKKLARDVSNVGHWGNGDYEISFNDDSKLEYILSLVKQAYLKNK